MSMGELLHGVAVVKKPGDRESLYKALRELGEMDSDFSGENGLEYLADAVWEANGYEDEADYNDAYHEYLECEDGSIEEPVLKFNSTMDYVISLLDEIEDDEDACNEFFDWFFREENYYVAHEVEYRSNRNKKLAFISVAAITHC